MLFIDIIGVTLLVAFAGWMCYLPANAIHTGVARSGRGPHKRRKQPVQFWMTVGAHVAFALMLLTLLAIRLLEMAAHYFPSR